ncbi:hypothetical protein E6O75_ATG01106 [Venturia nashicola]|uniref:Uncharacterized protein n=1 Tax=Venturia nashicola TaxID=86259 RepID=A0A4Z1PDJ3_9PEZI|nr:hypothetical protein E6O75_ATG01106 [Venturia nashicola]
MMLNNEECNRKSNHRTFQKHVSPDPSQIKHFTRQNGPSPPFQSCTGSICSLVSVKNIMRTHIARLWRETQIRIQVSIGNHQNKMLVLGVNRMVGYIQLEEMGGKESRVSALTSPINQLVDSLSLTHTTPTELA